MPFVRGTPSTQSSTTRSNKIDLDGESIASASSDELEWLEAKENLDEEEFYNGYSTNLHNLFQSGEAQLIGKPSVSSIQPIDKKEIP